MTALNKGIMRTLAKRSVIIILISVVISVFMLMKGTMVCHAGEGIEINSTNFPDKKFREFISEEYDALGEGVISPITIHYTTAILCQNRGITSLKGIEFFTNLERLHCDGNQLRTLDLGSNRALTYLNCNDNQLTDLNIRNNTNLTGLLCWNNQLTELDISKNTMLTRLQCNNNKMSTLDVSKNTLLDTLYCYGNSLKAIDVTRNTSLKTLDCQSNQLTSIDVSNNKQLETLDCSYNKLTAVNVSKNTALVNFECESNRLTSVDVSNNKQLEWFRCKNNKLTAVDVSKNTALRNLDCSSNQLSALDIRNNPQLITAYMNGSRKMDGNAIHYEFQNNKDRCHLWVDPAARIITAKGTEPVTPESPKATEPVIFKLPKVTLTKYNVAKLSWEKFSGASKYNVYQKAGSGKYKKIKTVKKTSFSASSLKAGKKYTFYVGAVNKSGKILAKSETAAVTTVGKPAKVKVSKENAKAVTVKWAKTAGASGYQISAAAKKKKTKAAGTSSSTTKIVKVTPGRKYFYKVRAYQIVNGKKIYGKWSSPVKFTLPKAKKASTKKDAATPSENNSTTQKALWCMHYLKISQVPGGDYSHKGTMNFDIVGHNGDNNIIAPFDCQIVNLYPGKKTGNTVVIQSEKPVQYADGTVDYMSMAFGHDDDISNLKVGTHLKQSAIVCQTGDYGIAHGIHSHVTCIKGKYKGNLWGKKTDEGISYCPDQINPVNALFIGNATVINAKGLKFKK